MPLSHRGEKYLHVVVKRLVEISTHNSVAESWLKSKPPHISRWHWSIGRWDMSMVGFLDPILNIGKTARREG